MVKEIRSSQRAFLCYFLLEYYFSSKLSFIYLFIFLGTSFVLYPHFIIMRQLQCICYCVRFPWVAIKLCDNVWARQKELQRIEKSNEDTCTYKEKSKRRCKRMFSQRTVEETFAVLIIRKVFPEPVEFFSLKFTWNLFSKFAVP